jgi:hypothetical protein
MNVFIKKFILFFFLFAFSSASSFEAFCQGKIIGVNSDGSIYSIDSKIGVAKIATMDLGRGAVYWATIFPEQKILALKPSFPSNLTLCHLEKEKDKFSIISVDPLYVGDFWMYAVPKSSAIIVEAGVNPVQSYDIVTGKQIPLTKEILDNALIGPHRSFRGEIVKNGIIVFKHNDDPVLECIGTPVPKEVKEYLKEGVFRSTPPPAPFLICSNIYGAVFGLSLKETEKGNAYMGKYLLWSRKDYSWEIWDMSAAVICMPMRGATFVCKDKIWLKDVSSEFTGKWFFYNFPTMTMSILYIGKEIEVIEEYGGEILIRKGDALYITPMDGNKVKDYKSMAEWEKDSHLIAKDPRIKEMKWLFLMPVPKDADKTEKVEE